MPETSEIFDATFRRRLEALDAALLRLRGRAGEGIARAGRALGQSEFRGHRPYTPGDDLRRLDWNAYGRLGKLFMREFERERTEHVTLLVDATRSMGAGAPPKSILARQIAAAFGYLALKRGGSATLAGHSATDGLARFARLLDQLRQAEPIDERPLAAIFESLAGSPRAPADLVVITDGLAPLESFAALQSLSERRTRVTLVQVLAPDEFEPASGQDLEIFGLEEQQSLTLTLDAETRAAYRAELTSHLEAIESMARRHGWTHVVAQSDADLTELFVGKLLAAGGAA